MLNIMENQTKGPNTALSTLSANDQSRWRAVCARAEDADGTFFYAVLTTGIYCRPSCPSRQPRLENIRFFRTIADAESAGFRPCKRCQPRAPSKDTQQRAMVERICRYIDNAESLPNLDALAAMADLSPHHFHRLFKRIVGLTPRAYGLATRRERTQRALQQESTVTDALYRAGFNSHGRFYASSEANLGMTPSAYRDGAAGVEIRFAIAESSLGAVLVAATVRGLCMVALGDDPDQLLHDMEDRFHAATLLEPDKQFNAVVAQVIALIEQPGAKHQLPLDLVGTAFQQRVWQALTRIPPGTTVSYGELASTLGEPRAARAVAAACAANAVAVAIPCHRVIRRDGAAGGYRWGVARKQALLQREEATRR